MADFLKDDTEAAQPAGNGSWILTFADLLSLLLTFFVLLFSMNAVQTQDWKPIVETMRRQFNPNAAQIVVEDTETQDLQRVYQRSGLNLSYVEGLMGRWILSDPAFSAIQMNRFQNRLILSIPAELFFDRKRAVLKPDGEQIIDSMLRPLLQVGNKIIIEGHTDRRVDGESGFISNWELSLTRARVVGSALVSRGYTAPVGVAGYADTRFLQLDDTLTLQERYELAERVDISILAAGQSRGVYDVF